MRSILSQLSIIVADDAWNRHNHKVGVTETMYLETSIIQALRDKLPQLQRAFRLLRSNSFIHADIAKGVFPDC